MSQQAIVAGEVRVLADRDDKWLQGGSNVSPEVERAIYMAEAAQRGDDLMLAKLSYNHGDLEPMEGKSIVDRFASAIAWAEMQAV